MSLSSFSTFTRSPLCSPKLSAHSLRDCYDESPGASSLQFSYFHLRKFLDENYTLMVIYALYVVVSRRYLLVRSPLFFSILILFQPFLYWRHDNPPRKLRLRYGMQVLRPRFGEIDVPGEYTDLS